jgi:hypothetical protein
VDLAAVGLLSVMSPAAASKLQFHETIPKRAAACAQFTEKGV